MEKCRPQSCPAGSKIRVQRGRRQGLTLVELLASVGIISVLAAIGLIQLNSIALRAKEGVETDTANLLNRAVLHYRQGNTEIQIEQGGDSSDEVSVVGLLQTRDPGLPGSPYIPSDMTFVPSSATNEVRFFWNGRHFEVLSEGTSGAGVIRQ